ncbi:DUF4336 domain-containing protein [Novosphingobium sp. ZN18A2]|uniref:DUF4336 domain-containing protein n=1 Tax=Novosphingobium sp. ZN18A2 TaxID=3079861 RepID=UPI0030CEFF6F
MLESLGPDIWIADGPVVDFYSFPYSTRMVLVRLADGALWAWSPIALTPELEAEVRALGEVRHLIGPNKIHHLSLGAWQQAFPQAKLWGTWELVKKRRDLAFDGKLGDIVPPEWLGEIDHYCFDNSAFIDEVDFFHRPSRTAIFADLTENFSRAFIDDNWKWWQRPIARAWKIVEPFGYAPLEMRASFRNRREARRKMLRLIAEKPERVVMAHGEIVRENGAEYLKRAFAWLL